jgi:histidinol-phosphate aminotransferase
MQGRSPSDVIKPEVRGLSAYNLEHVAAEVKLDQNENPYELPDELKTEIVQRVLARPWGRYPEFNPAAVTRTLAGFTGWDPAGILVGNGSNELIQATFTVTLGPARRLAVAQPTFTLYKLMATALQADVEEVMLNDELAFDVDKLAGAARLSDVTVICSPNNPTGTLLDRDALLLLLGQARGLVVVDEAYHEFSGQSALPLLEAHRNLIVLRTFSKAMAMAGLRFGYLLAHPDVAREIHKAKLPYNVNIFTLTAAELVLQQRDKFDRAIQTIISERDRVFDELRTRRNIRVFPSKANFLLVQTPIPARRLFESLYAQNVLVRDVSSYPLLQDAVRVSIGTPRENDRFLAALDHVMEQL